MAVAVKNTPELGNPLDRLPVVSLVGVVYVLVCLGVVFGALPWLWWNVFHFSTTSFAAGSVLGVVMLAAAVGLVVVGARGLGTKVPHGTRAGIFVALVGLLFVLLLTRWISLWVEHWAFDSGILSQTTGIVVVSLFGAGFLALALWLFFQRSSEKFLVTLEDQGWFHATSYKPLQGQRVRRGTILGILLLAGAGIYTLVTHQILKRGSDNWEIVVPFSAKVTVTDPGDATSALPGGFNPDNKPVLDRYDFQGIVADFDPATHVKILEHGSSKFHDGQVITKAEYEAERKKIEDAGGTLLPPVAPVPPSGTTKFLAITLLPSVQYTVPLLILAGSIWLGWRVVNFPAFADFLIATEAEINKVSWTTRKRLVQDTIVVLVTVVLLAGFLFTTDRIWQVLLSSRIVNVLQINTKQQETTNADRPLW
jgi:preprotein translocase SecE subunit